MTRTRPRVPDVLFAMAATTAIAGILVGLRAWWLAPAVALAALSPFLEWHPVPARTARALDAALRASFVLAMLVVWSTRPMPLIAGSEGSRLVLLLAALLAALAVVFLLGRRSFPPTRTLVPALLALMVLASAEPSPPGFGNSLVGAFRSAGHNGFAELFLLVAACVALALWAATLATSGPAWHGRDTGRLAAFVLISGALSVLGILGLPAAQPHVERVVAEALVSAATGLSSGSTLGELDELALSRRRVLDLRSSQPSPLQLHLRVEVLTRFDGRRWQTDPPGEGERLLPAGAGVLPPAERLVADLGPWFDAGDAGDVAGARLRVVRHAYVAWPLPLPRDVSLVSATTPWLERDRRGLLRPPQGSLVRLYGAVLPAHPGMRAPAENAELAECLSLPPRVAPAVAALARGLSRTATSSSERVARTVEHLRTHYRYTLQPGRFRADGDPVAEFLFDKREGYCEYFATAAVLLLRLQGIPARFVKGFTAGSHNHHGNGLYVVRDSDAHAWVDAYVAGTGWTEVDPTPPGDFASAHPGPGRLAQMLERLRAVVAELHARLTGPGLRRLLHWLAEGLGRAAAELAGRPWAIAGLLLGPLAWLLRRRLRALFERWARRRVGRAQSSLPRELLVAIDALEDRWRRLGRPRPAGRGLREHAGVLAIGPAAASTPEDADARRLIDLYYRARFGGESVSAEDLERYAPIAQGSLLRPRKKRTHGRRET